ncbi:unnamed protein product [Rhizoctonia solani]|uniref:Uncharacterized protein n=1 Tax=Rhizoctonia solani TaxID=456999 RepID=A0A8H3BAU0_9AGAM|nr:unnamed protein product [Rhizoctonia solani]
MSTPEAVFDFSQCAAGLADAATLLADAARHLSEAARAMSHGLQPELRVPHKLSLDEATSSECKSIKNRDYSDSEGANTGNNVQRPDSRIGRSDDLDPPAAPLAEKDQLAPYSESNPSPSREATTVTQDEFHSAILSPGRYYVVLEEEFDTLPLITAYASLCRKTLCCMPFIEESQSWRVLASLDGCSPQLLTPNTKTHRTASSISNSFLVWGFLNVEKEQLACVQDAVLSTHHTCAIVTPQEYQRPSFKAYLASLGFIEHPSAALINSFDGTSLLSSPRTNVQAVLHDSRYRSNIFNLYRTFLRCYSFPPRHIWWAKTRVAQLANSFAARILLHGREVDGSPRFKPDGRMIPVDQESISKFGLESTALLGLLQKDTARLPYSTSPICNPAAPSGPATLRTGTPVSTTAEKWYLILQEDFDAIPFICYQAERNPKAVCFISYGSTAEPYKSILELMVQRSVLRPGHSTDGTNKGLSTFNSLESAVLLLRGTKAISASHNSLDPKVDIVIYWGIPPEPHFTNNMNTLEATRTYVLISSVDDFMTRRQVTTRDGMKEYPGSVQMNSIGPTAPLDPYRDQTRRAMEIISGKIPKKIYNDQLGKWVKTDRSVSVRKSVIRANQFAARVLLHGETEDGSVLYPPVNKRPAVKRKQLAKCGLQPYVDEGLMWVGND